VASEDLKKILVVDDEEVVRDFYRDSLVMKGYSVDHASDGLDGLGKLWEAVYDLVITDINMPKLDGIGFYESACIRFPYLKDRFLFVTGSPAGSVRDIYGPDKIILKPFKIDDLFDMVNRMTARPLDLQFEEDGLNRRGALRVSCHNDCYMVPENAAGHTPVVARTQDISSQGLQVRYFGESVKPGDRVRMRIGNTAQGDGLIKREGHIVWARGVNHFVCAGVCFNEPLPDEIIDSLEKDTRTPRA